jgi:hypothetical protein
VIIRDVDDASVKEGAAVAVAGSPPLTMTSSSFGSGGGDGGGDITTLLSPMSSPGDGGGDITPPPLDISAESRRNKIDLGEAGSDEFRRRIVVPSAGVLNRIIFIK